MKREPKTAAQGIAGAAGLSDGRPPRSLFRNERAGPPPAGAKSGGENGASPNMCASKKLVMNAGLRMTISQLSVSIRTVLVPEPTKASRSEPSRKNRFQAKITFGRLALMR